MSRVVLTIAILALCAGTAKGQSDSVLTHALSDSTSVLVDRLSEAAAMRDERLPIGSIRLGVVIWRIRVWAAARRILRLRACLRELQELPGITGRCARHGCGDRRRARRRTWRGIPGSPKRVCIRQAARAIVHRVGAWSVGAFLRDQRNGSGKIHLLIPIGAIGGSLSMLGRCWKSRY